MELFWLVLTTLAAGVFAFLFGGWLDKRVEERQKEERQKERERWLSDLAGFSAGIAACLSENGLIQPYTKHAAETALCHHIVDYLGEGINDQEWEQLRAYFQQTA